ncbi:MAG TPA: methyltransferase regulatory domain-containing protein [Stenotrophomonas sp.]|nr:methyltransferase regulatory domain-containing protein [Stenotrophomonas sp.]
MANENDLIAAHYDDAPYLSCAFDASAPEHLRSVAWLFGLDAPDPATARVLELGCAAGGNIIPFAQRHPQAQVLGVDLSAQQVEEGSALIARMGLDNVRLAQRDLTSIDASLGQFDYILCHGVYSWVPAQVQAAILRVCRENLSPQGVAFVSYNTYPGWKTREVVRDAMRLHGARSDNPVEQLAHARNMIQFLRERVAPEAMLGRILAEHADIVQKGDDYYLMHEYLERHNQPCYFREFADAAQAHGLAYLAETPVASMFASNLGDEIAQALQGVGDQLELEQYLDFLRNRQFRQTLLVHGQRAAQMQRTLDPGRLRELHYSGHFSQPRPVAGATHKATLRTSRGADIDLAGEMALALAEILSAAYPNALHGSELLAQLQRRGFAPNAETAAEMAGLLGQLIAFNAVEFERDRGVQGVTSAGDFPIVWAPARHWYSHRFDGPQRTHKRWVVSPLHRTVMLDVARQSLLPLLDGTRSQAQLAEALVGLHGQGEITLRCGSELPEGAELAACARDVVSDVLAALVRERLLVG